MISETVTAVFGSLRLIEFHLSFWVLLGPSVTSVTRWSLKDTVAVGLKFWCLRSLQGPTGQWEVFLRNL